jgi:hypothetical protein
MITTTITLNSRNTMEKCSICEKEAPYRIEQINKRHVIKLLLSCPNDIKFCEEHNIIFPRHSFTEGPCNLKYHMHNYEETIIFMNLFLTPNKIYFDFISSPKRHTVFDPLRIFLQKCTLPELLTRMNKINTQLCFLAISKVKDIINLHHSNVYLYILDSVNKFDLKTLFWLLINKDPEFTLKYYYEKKEYSFVHYDVRDEKSKEYHKCYYCGILYDNEICIVHDDTKDEENLDDHLKLKCFKCLRVKQIVSDLFHIEALFSSKEYVNWINTWISKDCVFIVLQFMFDTQAFDMFLKRMLL